MRRLFVLIGMVAVTALTLGLGAGSLQAGTSYCETTCSGTLIKCCNADACTASQGVSVNCDGQILSCSTVSQQQAAYTACRNVCLQDRFDCNDACPDRPCLSDCADAYDVCLASCPKPVTSIGC